MCLTVEPHFKLPCHGCHMKKSVGVDRAVDLKLIWYLTKGASADRTIGSFKQLLQLLN